MLRPDRDSRARSSAHEQQMALAQSATLYIGNLSFYTTEEQMYELFARVTNVTGGGEAHNDTLDSAATCLLYTSPSPRD